MYAKHILCPVDFSDCGQVAIDTASTLASESKAKITFIHVDETNASMGAGHAAFIPPPDVVDQMLGQFHETKPTVFGIEFDLVDRRGRPADEIVHYAKTHPIDLIVMGTHGRRGLQHFVLGSVTEEVVRRAPCPVLSTRQNTAAKQETV